MLLLFFALSMYFWNYTVGFECTLELELVQIKMNFITLYDYALYFSVLHAFLRKNLKNGVANFLNVKSLLYVILS